MRLIPITAIKLVKILGKAGFKAVRQDGSHLRLIHPDGRATTIAIHRSGERNSHIARDLTCQDTKRFRIKCEPSIILFYFLFSANLIYVYSSVGIVHNKEILLYRNRETTALFKF
ncbi:MAG: type II toxin-antitoxin system HicA family toxin [Candidatus Aenigmarchaeota archaeon]|nr:type II toxin-antitoxin system HicA family toxin [Candidatus Aenigmarchaeota archaeon]